MPIDTPYNRMIAQRYNDMNRAKVAYVDNHLLDTVSSPAGYATTGYEPRTIGSGVGTYEKKSSCPKGHEVCKCGSGVAHGAGISATLCGRGNRGLEPAVRVDMALGAGSKKRKASQAELTNLYSELSSGSGHAHGGARLYKTAKNGGGNARGQARGQARGNARGFKEIVEGVKNIFNKGKKVYETGKEIYDVGKKAYDVGVEAKKTYDKLTKKEGGAVRTKREKHSEKYKGVVAHGKKKVNKRAEIVRKIMKEKGLKMIDASKYVKAHNLY
jgi:hypothetical protein